MAHARSIPPSLAEAYARCQRLAASHYENFPVASRLLPARMRPHVAAVYAFARAADDFADEGDLPAAERLAALDGWRRRLREATSGAPLADDDARLLFEALAHTIASHDLPIGLFEDLLDAFSQDVEVTRYSRWADVLDYCRRSANPVGRLVLRLAGVDRADADAWSDDVCTALQLTNFWQDLGVDWRRGRLYLPHECLAAAGAAETMLDAGRTTPPLRRALDDAVARTRTLFNRGRPVCDAVGGRLAFELRATWLGGVRVLDRVASTDVLATRPALGWRDGPWLIRRLLGWRR
jgi:phytoene synthase